MYIFIKYVVVHEYIHCMYAFIEYVVTHEYIALCKYSSHEYTVKTQRINISHTAYKMYSLKHFYFRVYYVTSETC